MILIWREGCLRLMVSGDDEEDWKVLMLDWSGRITYMTMAVHCPLQYSDWLLHSCNTVKLSVLWLPHIYMSMTACWTRTHISPSSSLYLNIRCIAGYCSWSWSDSGVDVRNVDSVLRNPTPGSEPPMLSCTVSLSARSLYRRPHKQTLLSRWPLRQPDTHLRPHL